MRILSCSKAAVMAALASVCLSGGAVAQSTSPDIIQCVFGTGAQTSDVTLLLPPASKAMRAQDVKISVVPSQLSERVGNAQFLPSSRSQVRQDAVQVGFLLSEDVGFVIKVARNGDGITYPVDLRTNTSDMKNSYLGRCDNVAGLFGLWR